MTMRRLLTALLLLLTLCACARTAEPISPEPSAPPEPDGPVCTITIRCDTLLDHLDELKPAVAALVPADGCLLPETTAALEPEDSVFDVLQRIAKEQGMHLEFSVSPLYGSAYLEGLCNLYEMDAGSLSGWTYSVNGLFPSYGISEYKLADGDEVRILYTCDLGADVGNVWAEP